MQIAAKNQPWTGKFTSLKSIATASTNKTAPVGEAGKDDARKALANALVWYYTDDTAYAEKAINILNVWAKSPTISFGTDPNGQNRLVAGWIGSLMGPAAEIMRGYTGWMQEDMAATQAMFTKSFYPFLKTASTWNGNVDLTQIDAMMAIAVFNEDKTLFDAAIARFKSRLPTYIYLKADGDTPKPPVGASWFSPTKLVDGLTQETCRDGNYNGVGGDGGHHPQYALAAAVSAAEVAWNQGVDLYGDYQARLVSALELLSLQLTSGTLQGTCKIDVATKESPYNTFEMGYNHYSHRKMQDLPNTKTWLETKVRVFSNSDWNIFFETLTHQWQP